MTLVAMKKQEFDSLHDERLGWACMEPTFLEIRGKDRSTKFHAISQLTRGQKALCMFRVLYDHAKHSVAEYYGWISYLLDAPDYWSGVIRGLSFFGDTPMICLLLETKEALESRNSSLGLIWRNATLMDLDNDNELRNAVTDFYNRFLKVSPDSLHKIGTYIRSNPQEFVIFENT